MLTRACVEEERDNHVLRKTTFFVGKLNKGKVAEKDDEIGRWR